MGSREKYSRMVESEEQLAAELEEWALPPAHAILLISLQKDYQPLDPALVRAILSDHDYADPEQLRAARELLETLRAEAVAEEDVLFDPSGTSGGHGVAKSGYGRNIAVGKSVSGSSDTSLSNEFSSLSVDTTMESDLSWGDDEMIDGSEKLSTSDKIANLLDSFPTESRSDIVSVLEECNGNFNRALDTLLNLVLLNQDPISSQKTAPLKGIDGFAQENISPRGRSRKNKKKFKELESSHEIDRIIPKYAPIQLSETSSSPRPASPVTPVYAGSSSTLATVRDANFAKASAYYRKGKSDHLMGGAAAYYATVGREASTARKSALADEADALVASQSTSTQMDLHGVSVNDAKRIASGGVRAWWHNLGEGRIRSPRSGVGEGFRIVTGLGVHSEGGVAKVGPAVMKMLVNEGWKVEVGRGVLIVTGVTRKK
jgi:hypothetical protein